MINLKKCIALLLISLSLVACNRNSNDEIEIIKSVKVEKIYKDTNIVEKYFPGTIKEKQFINLAFRVAGPIKNIFVEEGQYVKKGQLIAEIDPRDYITQLNAAKAQYEQVKSEAERVEELYKRKSVAANDYEKALSGKKMLNEKISHAKDQLEDTKLIAPFSGYIQKINFDENEMIDAGMPVISMIDVNMLKVETSIPSSIYIKKDSFINFSCVVDVLGNKVFPLELIEINHKSNNNQLYKASFQLNPKLDKRIAPGMNVKVNISYSNEINYPLSVPLTAIFKENDKVYVFEYIKKDSTIKYKEIITDGILKNGRIKIKSGLSGKETIVVAGVKSLNNGQKVKLLNKYSKTNVGGML